MVTASAVSIKEHLHYKATVWYIFCSFSLTMISLKPQSSFIPVAHQYKGGWCPFIPKNVNYPKESYKSTTDDLQVSPSDYNKLPALHFVSTETG
jgi:hypothetical protein